MENIIKLADTLIRNEKTITFPLKHSAAGMIMDAKGNHILDIRGWGRIQYHPGGTTKAAQLQDALADWVAEALNKQYYATESSA